jgi:tRNA 2-thiouridine synthesizing protein D
LSLHSCVTDHNTLALMNRFALSLVDQKHTINAIFLYQDAVFHASRHLQLPSDELNTLSLWSQLSERNIPLLLCSTAAEKRGVLISDKSYFKQAGLAEFAMISSQSDKLVQFK